MASEQSIEGGEGYPPPRRSEPGGPDEDVAVLKAAELVLLAHERCVSLQEQSGTGLSTAVGPTAYAEVRDLREDAFQKLMGIRARGRRGLSAKKIVLAILITWLGSEDPNCAHAMTLLDEYDLVMSGGKSGSDPGLAALRANWVNRSATSLPQALYEAEDCAGYR